MFVLLARDPQFCELILQWADQREREIFCGLRPDSDIEAVFEARRCAMRGQTWRKQNNGKWRKPADEAVS